MQPADLQNKSKALHARDIDLVPATQADVSEKYIGWLHDDEVVKYLEVKYQNRSKAALEAYIRDVEKNPNQFFYFIHFREKFLPIGTINISVNTLHLTGYLGFMVGDKDYWGGDYLTQAEVVLMDFAFDVLGLRKVSGATPVDNIGSNFNLSNLGFVKEGVLKNELRYGDSLEFVADAVRYGLVADRWREICGKHDALRKQ